MNRFVHICALIIAPESATTGTTQVKTHMHPIVQPHMHSFVHLYGDS